MKKKVAATLLAGVMALSVLGGTAMAGESGGKHLTWGDTTFNAENEEADINPHNTYAGWACMRYGIGETLFKYSDSMELEPWVASGYEMIDENTWKITINDKVVFSNGKKVDGAAVKACLEHLIEVHDRAKEDLQVDSIEADGQDVTIHTKTPRPAIINYLCDPYGCIIDMEAGISDDGIVIGTGPYVAESLVTDQELNLVKNENYWNGEPKLNTIQVRTISDGDTLTMALQSGEIDVAYGMSYASYPLFENDSYTFSSTPTSRAFYAWMNFESPVVSDPAVRKAVAMGIDKQGFVDVLLNGYGYPGNGVFPETFSFGGQNVTTETYDPDGAKMVLEDAGWVDSDGDGIREKDGQALTIRWLTYPSRQELPLLAEYAQSTLKDIGMDVQINSTADHNSIRKDRSQWDIYASAMVTAPTGDPEYFFTSCCLDESSNNNGAYHSDKLEELEKTMSQTFDPEKRGKIAIDMQQTILDDNAYVFCSFLKMSMISKSTVSGVTAHPCDYYEITADLDKAE